jgi:glucuronate isomerase
MIDQNRYLVSDPAQRQVARNLYEITRGLPLVCPHGHVDPHLFADQNYHFDDPVGLLIKPDHYVLRILHARGIEYEKLGIPGQNGKIVEEDPRKIWQLFAEYFYCYDATPTGLWIRDELAEVFGIEEKLTAKNAQVIYDSIQKQLNALDFTPRKLYQLFNISVLCTTDSASDELHDHQVIASTEWSGHILPTFRADTIVHIDQANWVEEITALSKTSSLEIKDFPTFLQAIESRRSFFKQMGATATDLAVVSANSEKVAPVVMESLFQKGINQKINQKESAQFVAGMLLELARMSAEDGLVMQLHVGSYRNHDEGLFESAGPNLGADFPVPVTFTQPLRPLLDCFGNHPNFHMILFTLDETTYARELAPLASYYPSIKLGPPWWFHDNLNGMQRFFEQAIDSGGLYSTAGFNDDTRAFLSIPARHDVWRRASANWLSNLVVRHVVDEESAHEMMKALACGLAIKAYKLEQYAPAEARIA